jgi:hypothetical protein
MSRHRRSGVVAARVIVGLGALLVGATVAGARQERAKADPKANALMGPREGLLDRVESGPSLPDDDELAGLPRGSRPPVLTLRRAYELALIRHRTPSPPRPGDRLSGLDPKALGALGRHYSVADFARFRRDALERQGHALAFRDPAPGFLAILSRVHAVESTRRLVHQEARLMQFFQEQVNAELGIIQLDVDQLGHILGQDRADLLRAITDYREAIDDYKVELGLPPQAPLVIDRGPLEPLYDVFRATDRWKLRPERRLEELPGIILRLPEPPDIMVVGRPLFDPIDRDPTAMEATLRLATETAEKAPGAPPGDPARTLRVRHLLDEQVDLRLRYSLEKKSYALALRVVDQLGEQYVMRAGEVRAEDAHPARPVLTNFDILQANRKVHDHEDQLVRIWTSYQAGRVTLMRELGLFPYVDWDSYLSEILPPPPPKAPDAPAPKLEAEPLPPPPPDK